MPQIVPKDKLLEMKGWTSPWSDFFEIEQARIDQFADATGDHQFIHVDPERAAQTAFGGTIAHGYLTLSLLPRLLEDITPVPEDMTMAINYGLDKVRFVEAVRSGSRVRAGYEILEVVEKSPNRILVSAKVTVAIAGRDRPALVAETLSLFVTS